MNYDKLNVFEIARRTREEPLPAGRFVGFTQPVTLPGDMDCLLPAEIVYSQNRHNYVATFQVQNSKKIYTFTGPTEDAVKKQLVQKFGSHTVVFSTERPAATEDNPRDVLAKLREADRPVTEREIQEGMQRLVRAYGQVINGVRQLAPGTEITSEMAQKVSIRPKAFEAMQARFDEAEIQSSVEQYRQLCRTMSEQEREAQWQGVCLEMIKNSEISSEFLGREDFFDWPIENNKSSGFNWKQLIEICHAQGLPEHCVPALFEIINAYKYGVAHNHFHLQKTYKRHTESGVKNSVRPFTQSSISEDQETLHQRAMAKVQQYALPAGTRITWERAQMMGLNHEEFSALLNARNEATTKSFNELQTEARGTFRKDAKIPTFAR